MKLVINLKCLNQGVESQDGRHSNTVGPLNTRRLDGEDRFKGCILHHSNSPSPPASPEVHSGGSRVPIHLSPLRPIMCSVDICQGDEAFDDTAEVMGNQDNYLY